MRLQMAAWASRTGADAETAGLPALDFLPAVLTRSLPYRCLLLREWPFSFFRLPLRLFL
jgi:hypothetical protein